MSASTFGWLDYSEGDRRRMLEVVNLFREKGTLDELGIGTIRDTFAEHFFPGTSTIQTRARYFLFIPWIYSRLEHDRVPSNRVDGVAREQQWRLVQSLQTGGEGANKGVVGIEAGANVQRLPSTIYWQGLKRWGIRLFEGSTDRYHASLDTYYRGQRTVSSSEGGELLESARRNWHGSLPHAPPDLLEHTTFSLTLVDAEFLLERIRHSARDSLLAACLSKAITGQQRARAPWDLGGLGSLPIQLQDDIEAARRYSLAMEGAVLLYNRMLAELAAERGLSQDSSRVDRYGQELERWADEMVGDSAQLQIWDRRAFWSRLRRLNPSLPVGAERFSDTWMSIAIAGPRTVMNNENARQLIGEREYRLKTALARLHNPRALERWSGESGVGRLTFRWGNAQRILLDILSGLRQSRVPA